MADQIPATKGFVLYTDGAARPNPGPIGWGCHGYYYTTAPAKQGPGLKGQLITQLGYISSSKKVESTYIVQPLEYFDYFGSLPDIGTNSLAEITALLMSLERVLTLEYEYQSIRIYTDSQYLQKGINEDSQYWARNNWTRTGGGQIAHVDLWKRLLQLRDIVISQGATFDVEWIKGHADLFGNVHADHLATLAVNHAIRQETRTEYRHSDPKGYWKNNTPRSPLLNHNLLYFTTQSSLDPGRYYLIDSGKENRHKRNQETSLAIVYLESPDPVIEQLKVVQKDLNDECGSIFSMSLDRVYSGDIYANLQQYGVYCLSKSKGFKLGLNYLDDHAVTDEIRPVGLCIRALDNLAALEERLQEHMAIRAQPEHPTTLQCFDITDLFYEPNPKKPTQSLLKSMFVVGYKAINATIVLQHQGVGYPVSLPLILGMDMPGRNNLKRMEDQSPEITLITWPEDTYTYHYAVIVRLGGDVGIWSNYYSNRFTVGIPKQP